MFVAIFIATLMLSYVIAGYTSKCWPGKGFFLLLLPGYKKIYFYQGQHFFNEDFTSVGKFKEGNLVSVVYRYPDAKVGEVELNPDGTAYYCGTYKWSLQRPAS